MQLRWYQNEANDRVLAYLFEMAGRGYPCNPLVVLPTGSGKSLVINDLIYRILSMYPTQKIVVSTHVKELIEQSYTEMFEHWPYAPAGVCSAGLGVYDTQSQIVYGGVKTLLNRVEGLGVVHVLMVDECHLIDDKANTTYQKLITLLRTKNPHLVVIGYTATDFRLGMGKLTEGDLFTHVVYDMSTPEAFSRLFAEGFLVPPVAKLTTNYIDTDGIAVVGGEFNKAQLEARSTDKLLYDCLAEACAMGQNRRSWLAFCSGVESAQTSAKILRTFGVPCEAVYDGLGKKLRKEYIDAFKNFELRALTNNNILTTGFNHPALDFIIGLRATTSPSLWVQMLGRGTRPYVIGGKRNCIAEGTPVLTDCGLVLIENVTAAMRVWDGIDYVAHDGTIFCGEQITVAYAGLEATPDHRVWTAHGWTAFGECRQQSIAIAATEHDGQAIPETDCYFVGGNPQGFAGSTLRANTLRRLFTRIRNGLFEYDRGESELPFVRQSNKFPSVVGETLYFRETAMHKSEQSGLGTLRRTRYPILLRNAWVYGAVRANDVGIAPQSGIRQNRQRRSLRSRQFTILDTTAKPGAHAETAPERVHSRLPNAISRNTVRGQHIADAGLERANSGTNSGTLQSPLQQTKRRVWDILNAGPLHRFTAGGLLVSNCYVADFARNAERLGTIDDPKVPRKKKGGGGDMPIWLCPNCGTKNHARAAVCIDCGMIHVFETKLTDEASIAPLVSSDDPEMELFTVEQVIYLPHHPKPDETGKVRTSSLRVTYYAKPTSGRTRKFDEWVFPAHDKKFLVHKFHNWWKQRHLVDPPTNLYDVQFYIDQLRTPKQIKVWTNKKPFPEIMGATF